MRDGTKNLIPLNQRTKDEQKIITRQGGVASGAARRAQKSMREWAEVFGAVPVSVPTPDGLTVESTTLGTIVAAQMAKATKGDTKAAKFIADLLGEIQQNVNIKGGIVPVPMEREEMLALSKWAKTEE